MSECDIDHWQVVGIHEDACEVLFDAEFPGGTDLNGR